METETMISKPRKSAALTKEEHKALKAYRKTFLAEVDCAATIGIDRMVLNRTILLGKCSPKTLDKIKAVLKVNGTGGL